MENPEKQAICWIHITESDLPYHINYYFVVLKCKQKIKKIINTKKTTKNNKIIKTTFHTVEKVIKYNSTIETKAKSIPLYYRSNKENRCPQPLFMY